MSDDNDDVGHFPEIETLLARLDKMIRGERLASEILAGKHDNPKNIGKRGKPLVAAKDARIKNAARVLELTLDPDIVAEINRALHEAYLLGMGTCLIGDLFSLFKEPTAEPRKFPLMKSAGVPIFGNLTFDNIQNIMKARAKRESYLRTLVELWQSRQQVPRETWQPKPEEEALQLHWHRETPMGEAPKAQPEVIEGEFSVVEEDSKPSSTPESPFFMQYGGVSGARFRYDAPNRLSGQPERYKDVRPVNPPPGSKMPEPLRPWCAKRNGEWLPPPVVNY